MNDTVKNLKTGSLSLADEIERLHPSRRGRSSVGFAPYGHGTHTSHGSRWKEMHVAVSMQVLAHFFMSEVSLAKYAGKLRFNPVPLLKPSKKPKLCISEQERELPA